MGGCGYKSKLDNIKSHGTHIDNPAESELRAKSELNQDLVAHGRYREELRLAFHGPLKTH